MLDHEEVVRDLKKALQRAHVRNKNVKKQLVRSHQSQQRATDIIASLRKDSDATKKRLASILLRKRAETRLKNVYKQKYISSRSSIAKLQANASKMRQKLIAAEKEVEQLRATAQQNTSNKIVTLSGSPPRYTDSVRQCCIELLARNVGINHVSPVIQIVIRHMTKLHMERLPSPSKMSAFLGEAKQLVLTQIGECLLSADNLTLHRDGTTKQGKKYYGAQIATSEKTLTIGLSEVMSGSADHCFQAVVDMLHAVEKSCKNAGSSSDVFNEIVGKIKNTMTDRGSVEKKCNSLLQEFRSNVLPLVTNGWDGMSDDERNGLCGINNFYCGLHFVVGLAEQAQETLKRWEKAHGAAPAIGGIQRSSEAGTVRLVRTVCKALEAHCNEQSGNHSQFRAYLTAHGVGAIPLARFVGNRFNILFYNAGGVYFLRDFITEFYDKAFGTPNRLHVAVREDIAVDIYLAACRALGIIDKLVTGPLWRKLADPSTSICEMSAVYTSLCDNFDGWSTNSQDLLDGSAKAFTDAEVSVDEVQNELFTSCENDATTLAVLQLLFTAFAPYSRRLLTDHLPDGKFHVISAIDTNSVATTNVVSERTFAQLDRLKREKPNASVLAIEGMVLFATNKTAAWLQAQTSERRKHLLDSALHGAEEHRQLYRERCLQISEFQQQQIQQKEQERLAKETHTIQMKQQLSLEISKTGLWTTPEEVSLQLSSISTASGKLAALKSQLKFRRFVLQQPADKSLFQWSSAGKTFRWQELSQNLLTLIADM